mmetsp:Transcript_9796/g.34132  ORF Transcript_9796/g.34132 Transcript_9796/m.34132 type:complete len:698 (+) Transcript_9796:423-2516(+)
MAKVEPSSGTGLPGQVASDSAGAVVETKPSLGTKSGGETARKKEAFQVMMEKYEVSPYLFDPRSTSMNRWDMYIAILLLYTALVTPFEVGFLQTEIEGPSLVLYCINRLVDFSFFLDIFVNFNLAYYDSSLGSGTWVTDRGKIASRYAKGFFVIDVASIVPFDSMPLMMSGDAADDMNDLKVLRLLRLLRLIKLLRILKSGRMLRKLEDNIHVDYGVLTLTKFIVGTLFIAHWLACLFAMLTGISGYYDDWLTGYFQGLSYKDCRVEDYADTGIENSDYRHCLGITPYHAYVAALYWALVTMSTIGYGDVTPTNTDERFFIIFAMLIGTSVFAYVVGSVCGIVQNMDRKNTEFYELMDSLNGFMREANLDIPLRLQLRDYFRYKRRSTNMDDWKNLLNLMSPKLRGQVAEAQCGSWLNAVPFFRGAPHDFVVDVALLLSVKTFPPEEEIIKMGDAVDCMFIVERGVVGGKGRVFTMGKVFGEEALFSAASGSPEASSYVCRAMTYTDLFCMHADDLKVHLVKYPLVAQQLRKAAVKAMARDALVQFTEAWGQVKEGLTSPPGQPSEPTEEDNLFSPGRDSIKRKQVQIFQFALAVASASGASPKPRFDKLSLPGGTPVPAIRGVSRGNLVPPPAAPPAEPFPGPVSPRGVDPEDVTAIASTVEVLQRDMDTVKSALQAVSGKLDVLVAAQAAPAAES